MQLWSSERSGAAKRHQSRPRRAEQRAFTPALTSRLHLSPWGKVGGWKKKINFRRCESGKRVYAGRITILWWWCQLLWTRCFKGSAFAIKWRRATWRCGGLTDVISVGKLLVCVCCNKPGAKVIEEKGTRRPRSPRLIGGDAWKWRKCSTSPLGLIVGEEICRCFIKRAGLLETFQSRLMNGTSVHRLPALWQRRLPIWILVAHSPLLYNWSVKALFATKLPRNQRCFMQAEGLKLYQEHAEQSRAEQSGASRQDAEEECFYDYHAVQISRSSFFRASSAVGLFCIISSALDTDGNIKRCSLHPSAEVSIVETWLAGDNGEKLRGSQSRVQTGRSPLEGGPQSASKINTSFTFIWLPWGIKGRNVCPLCSPAPHLQRGGLRNSVQRV